MALPKSDRGLSAETQIELMGLDYPNLAVLHAASWSILWRGILTPYAQPYVVQLHYCAFSLQLAAIKSKTVHVEVLSPLLRRRAGAADPEIPHIYPNPIDKTLPRLCLHMQHEWNSSMSIADTIVPWTVEWLAAYEGWRATGLWSAGGHNTERRVANR
jgi:hypothetical protein